MEDTAEPVTLVLIIGKNSVTNPTKYNSMSRIVT